MIVRLLLCSLLAVVACSRVDPGDVTGKQKILVLAYDAGLNGGEYRLVTGNITTLHSLRTMRGDAAEFTGGAKIRFDDDTLGQLASPTEDAIRSAITVSSGGLVDFASFMVDGIIHPEDFQSLNLATTYYNFERAHLFFAGLNVPLYNLPVQYMATVEAGAGGQFQPITDNVFWDPLSRQFFIPPFNDLQALPLSMNLGVIAHEYAHAVFTNRFYPASAGAPWLLKKRLAEPEKYARAAHLAKGIDEGLADVFGAFVSNDPSFMRKSIPELAEERRLDVPDARCATPDMIDALSGDDADFDPYAIGSVLSAALWQASANAGDRRNAFARGLVDAMDELGARFQARDAEITLTEALDAIAKTINADLKPRACGLLIDRFHLQPTDLPTCTEVREPELKCR